MRSSRRTSVGELIALAKEKPGAISYGTSGVGSAGHVNIALLESMAGVKLQAGALSRRGAGAQRRRRRPHPAHSVSGELGAAAVAQRHGQDARHRQRATRCPASRRCRQWPKACRATRRSPGSGCSPPRGTPRDVGAQDQCRGAAPVQRAGVPQALRRAAAVRGDGVVARSSSMISSRPRRTKWAKVIRDANLKVD